MTAAEGEGGWVGRVAALGAIVLAGVVLAVVLLGGEPTHRYSLVFQNAGQLVVGDDVQVGGRRVGSIDDITLTRDNQARIAVSVQEPFAPLHAGTSAVIRATSLSGVANRYVALDPRPAVQRRARRSRDADGRSHDVDRRPRPALQHVRRPHAARPDQARAFALDAVRGQGPARRPGREVLQPGAVEHAPAGQRAVVRRGPADGLPGRHLAHGRRPRRAPRRPVQRGLEHERRPRVRSRRSRPSSTRRCARCRRRCGAATRPSSTCARRSTTSTGSSPPRSRRPSGWRRSCACCAR